MYDLANNRLPPLFDNTFKNIPEIQEIRLTLQANHLHVGRGTSTFYQHLPLYSLHQIWNIWKRLVPTDVTRGIFTYLYYMQTM